MTPVDLPDEVKSFLLDYIDSASQLEVLMLLHDQPTREWTSASVLQELRSNEASATRHLEYFERRKLAARSDGPATTFRYAPATPDLARAIDELAAHRTTFSARIIHFIYNKSIEQMREFSEAFRIRKGGDE